MKYRSLLLALVVLFLFQSCTPPIRHAPRGEKGLIDLRGYDFHKDGPFALDGEWQFFWKELLDPSSFVADSLRNAANYLNVPGIWNDQEIHGERLNGIGYGTYHIRILRTDTSALLALRLLDAASAYRLFVNGQELSSNGVVSAIPNSSVAAFVPRVAVFHDTSKILDCVVHVSNSAYYKGGLWESIKIGRVDDISTARDRSVFLDVFVMGVLLILTVYHVWIFIFRKSDKLALWFALSCVSLAIRAACTGDRVIMQVFPTMSYQVLIRLEYLTVGTVQAIFISYMYYFFSPRVPKVLMTVAQSVAVIQSLYIIAAPLYTVTGTVLVFQSVQMIATAIMLVFAMYFTVKKVQYAGVYLFSSAAMAGCVINDTLYANMVVNTAYIGPLGMSFYLGVQAYFLASRIAENFVSLEKLSRELQHANLSLEARVEERTHALEQQSRDLEIEKQKADDLLANILPEGTARELKLYGRAQPKTYGMVSVLFTDFKDFSLISERISPELLVQEIDACFSAFDEIVERHRLEKIKTVGDAYIAVGGLPDPNYTHALDAVRAAQDIQTFMQNRMREKTARGELTFEVRIGIHTGPVVAGIVGKKKFAYDIWGDSVNLAARMEQSSEAGKINISGATYALVKEEFQCEYRGKIDVKNKGQVDSYFVQASHVTQH